MHLLFFFANPLSFLDHLRPKEEWVIEAEMLTDFSGKDQTDAIKSAKKGEELKVMENILPQLPKQIDTSEQKKPEEEKPEEISDEKKEIIAAEKPVEEKPKETPKEISKEAEKDDKEQKSENEDLKMKALAQLAKQEAIERLAKEKARLEKKFAKENESAEANTLLKQRQNALSQGIDNSSTEIKEYNRALKDWVQKHYIVPEIYISAEEQSKVVVEIVLDSKGEIQTLELIKSSTNTAFDQLALTIIKNAAPFPKPPKELVGQRIHYRFDRSYISLQ